MANVVLQILGIVARNYDGPNFVGANDVVDVDEPLLTPLKVFRIEEKLMTFVCVEKPLA